MKCWFLPKSLIFRKLIFRAAASASVMKPALVWNQWKNLAKQEKRVLNFFRVGYINDGILDFYSGTLHLFMHIWVLLCIIWTDMLWDTLHYCWPETFQHQLRVWDALYGIRMEPGCSHCRWGTCSYACFSIPCIARGQLNFLDHGWGTPTLPFIINHEAGRFSSFHPSVNNLLAEPLDLWPRLVWDFRSRQNSKKRIWTSLFRDFPVLINRELSHAEIFVNSQKS